MVNIVFSMLVFTLWAFGLLSAWWLILSLSLFLCGNVIELTGDIYDELQSDPVEADEEEDISGEG